MNLPHGEVTLCSVALANRPFNRLGGWRLTLQPVIRLPGASPFLLWCQHFPGFRAETMKGHSITLRATVLRPSPSGRGRHAACGQLAPCGVLTCGVFALGPRIQFRPGLGRNWKVSSTPAGLLSSPVGVQQAILEICRQWLHELAMLTPSHPHGSHCPNREQSCPFYKKFSSERIT